MVELTLKEGVHTLEPCQQYTGRGKVPVMLFARRKFRILEVAEIQNTESINLGVT